MILCSLIFLKVLDGFGPVSQLDPSLAFCQWVLVHPGKLLSSSDRSGFGLNIAAQIQLGCSWVNLDNSEKGDLMQCIRQISKTILPKLDYQEHNLTNPTGWSRKLQLFQDQNEKMT